MYGTIQKRSAMLTGFVLNIVIAYFISSHCWSSASAEVTDSKMMCGPNCLWLVARSFDIHTSLKKLRYFAGTDACRGTSVNGMLKALRQIGLEPLLIRTSWRGLSKIRNPVILLIKESSNDHYVFLEELGHKTVRVIDPPDKKTWTQREFMNKFTGYAIVVCRNSQDRQEIEKQFRGILFSHSAKTASILLAILFCGILTLVISRTYYAGKNSS
jgi:ABC-type bacteriocin/lantibiotic exporter with double-glycine peptidase domain